MARPTIAEQYVDLMARAGVRRVYGVVGDSLNPVVDAVRRHDTVEWIQVRHEEVAAFAAGAEAQLTGRLAACAGSCGPGNLHLINGLYDAHRSMAPVLALAAQIPSGQIGTGYFQETHPDRLFAECSHYSELISSPRQMPRVVQTAIQPMTDPHWSTSSPTPPPSPSRRRSPPSRSAASRSPRAGRC